MGTDTADDAPKKVKPIKRSYFVYAPPRIYCYKSELEETPIDVISLELFIVQFKLDHLGARILLNR